MYCIHLYLCFGASLINVYYAKETQRRAARKRKCGAICNNNNTQRGNHVTCHALKRWGAVRLDSWTNLHVHTHTYINKYGHILRDRARLCSLKPAVHAFFIKRKNVKPLMTAISAISILLTGNLQYLREGQHAAASLKLDIVISHLHITS